MTATRAVKSNLIITVRALPLRHLTDARDRLTATVAWLKHSNSSDLLLRVLLKRYTDSHHKRLATGDLRQVKHSDRVIYQRLTGLTQAQRGRDDSDGGGRGEWSTRGWSILDMDVCGISYTTDKAQAHAPWGDEEFWIYLICRSGVTTRPPDPSLSGRKERAAHRGFASNTYDRA